MSKLLILFLFLTGALFSQDTPDKIVELNLSPITKTIKRDSVISLKLLLKIKDGWHINSNKPLDSNLVPTVVSFNDTSTFKVLKIKYPQPLLKKLSFSDNELALYEDEAAIIIQIIIDKNYKKRNLVINGKLQFQPCNNQTCLFPSSKTFSVGFNL